MAFKIISKKEEPLLSRTRVKAHITFEAATPSNQEITKKLSSNLDKDEKLVKIKKIDTKFGSTEADIVALVYDSEKEMKNIEKKTKKQREAEEKKKAEEEKKKEEKPKESKDKEEKKEKPKEDKEE